MIPNSDNKKTIIKSIKLSVNTMSKIDKYMKENQLNKFSKFIDSLIEKELNKEGKTLFSVWLKDHKQKMNLGQLSFFVCEYHTCVSIVNVL